MQDAPGGRRRIRTTSVEAGLGGRVELRADQAAADTAAGAESGMVLDMRLSFSGRWQGEARGASGSRPAACRRGPESPRRRGRLSTKARDSNRVSSPQFRRRRSCSPSRRPHIGNKVIRPSYDRRARVPVAPHPGERMKSFVIALAVALVAATSVPGDAYATPHRRRRRAPACSAACRRAPRPTRPARPRPPPSPPAPPPLRPPRPPAAREALLDGPDRRPRRRPRHRRSDEPPRPRRGASATS